MTEVPAGAQPAAAQDLGQRPGFRDRCLVLVGFMGSGKTTEARMLDRDALDVDELIERREGRPVAEIMESDGEPRFRELEEQLTLEALDSSAGRVVALGGGAVESGAVRAALGHHTVAWLDVDTEAAWRRVGSGAGEGSRPLARDRARFAELHSRRRRHYAEVSDAVFSRTARGAVGEALPSLDALGCLPAGTRMLWAVAGRDGGHPVFVGIDLLAERGFGVLAGGRAAAAEWPASGRAFVVTDRGAWEAVACGGEPALAGSLLHVLEPGEQSKSLEVAGEVLEAMAGAGWTRADHVAAVGGGMVGDLAGFCAHTYQRGVPVVQVPTTVVGQVDAAYGGKTGVDLPAAKNYVGAYHPPAAVIADASALATLPYEELAAGMVEVIKTGLLAGGELWEAVKGLASTREAVSGDPRLVFECARLKCDVVAADERDAGLRQILNLGHTVGHAIEAAAGYGTYRHGEAVGLGLLAALRLSGADELREEVAGLLSRWSLPTAMSPRGGRAAPATEELLEAIRRDKKRLGEEVPFVLLAEAGRPQYGMAVGERDLVAAIEELYGP